MVGELMKSGRNRLFTDTGMNYLYQLAAERALNPVIVEDDELFEGYLRQTNINTAAMRFGTEQEGNARELYNRVTGLKPVEVGSIKHKEIAHFASSPDGYYYDDVRAEGKCIEIKCPNPATYMKYRSEIKDAGGLLRVMPKYYYQCMAHMMCTGATTTDFVAYCPFVVRPIHIVTINANADIFDQMESRIKSANKIIEEFT